MKWVAGVLIALCALVALLLLWSVLNRRRLEHKHPISERTRKGLEARLLNYIKSKSGDQREDVPLRAFWRQEARAPSADSITFGKRVPNIIRDQVIRELVRKKHIKISDPIPPSKENGKQNNSSTILDDLFAMIGDMVGELAGVLWSTGKDGWAIPAPTVRLTDGTFYRMTHGDNGWKIIGGVVQHNEGTFVNSPLTVSAGDADVTVNRVGSELQGNPFSAEVLDKLVDIFRRDAETAPRAYREQMNDVAAGLEKEAGEDVPNEEAVIPRIRRAKRVVAGSAGLFAASSEAIRAWIELKNTI